MKASTFKYKGFEIELQGGEATCPEHPLVGVMVTAMMERLKEEYNYGEGELDHFLIMAFKEKYPSTVTAINLAEAEPRNEEGIIYG